VHEKKKGLKEMSLYIIVDARAEEPEAEKRKISIMVGSDKPRASQIKRN